MNDTKVKLSTAQKALLKSICEFPHYVAEYYPPAKVLVRLGLAIFEGNNLTPTTEGKSINANPTHTP